MPRPVMLKKLKLNGSMKTYKTLRTNTQKRRPFHYRGLEWKSRGQESLGVTGKFGLGVQNEAGQRLIEVCQENTLVLANTLFQQHKRRLHMDITRWSMLKSYWLSSWQPKMEKLYTVGNTRPGAELRLRSCTPYCQLQSKIEKSGENH